MGQLNANGIFGAIRGLFSALDTTDEALLRSILMFDQYTATVTDGGTAATAATETALWTNNTGTNQLVTGVTIATPIAVTGDNTNNATVTVTRRDSAGINPLVVATLTTNVATGNFTAFLPKALTLTVANVVVPPGGILTVLVSKGGTGVAIGAATSQSRVQVQLQPIQ